MFKLFGLALLSASLLSPLPVQAQTVNYKFVWPAGTATLEQKIQIACRQFGCNPTQLIRVMRCESKSDALAVNRTEPGTPTGLFQHKAIYWNSRAQNYGIPGASIWSADAQIWVTTQMFAQGQAWQWACK